eukprot:1145222-Pelagomonas_calceolata.AAC.10
MLQDCCTFEVPGMCMTQTCCRGRRMPAAGAARRGCVSAHEWCGNIKQWTQERTLLIPKPGRWNSGPLPAVLTFTYLKGGMFLALCKWLSF